MKDDNGVPSSLLRHALNSTNDGVVMLTMLLTEDRGIRAYRLERWIGGEVTVLFDGLPDLPDTWADVDALVEDVGYRPSTPVEEGVKRFVDWYLSYYRNEHRT